MGEKSNKGCFVFFMCAIILALTLMAIKYSHDAKLAVPFIIKGDVEYVYEGDSVVHHYPFDDKYDPKSSVKSIEVEYTAPAGYINRMVLTVKMTPTGCLPTRYDRELFYVPDKRFTVKNITWKFVQTRNPK
jgi:hypothetical protein